MSNPWAGMMSQGGMGGGMLGGGDPNQMLQHLASNPALMQQVTQQMQSPYMRQMMQAAAADPQFIARMEASNPMMRQMFSGPQGPAMRAQMQAMFSNPDMVQQMMNPQNLQAMA